jgi:hypothetical protein
LSEEAGMDLKPVIDKFMRQKTNLILHVRKFAGSYLRVTRKQLPLPINVKTSSSTKSVIQWLPDTIDSLIIVPSLDTSDWYLVNEDQFGFYRVNYEKSNWQALIKVLQENPETFSEKTRAQLIDDSMFLAKNGLLEYFVAFDMMMALKVETFFLPWSSGMKNMLELNDLLTLTDIHHEFQVSLWLFCLVWEID